MPTILRVQGLRIYFYSHEPNEPLHVHLDKGGASAEVWLEPILLASNAGFPTRDLSAMLRLVRFYQSDLLEAWHDFFGTG